MIGVQPLFTAQVVTFMIEFHVAFEWIRGVGRQSLTQIETNNGGKMMVTSNLFQLSMLQKSKNIKS
jgi:hypothetical protein